jgi:hypothetical protein
VIGIINLRPAFKVIWIVAVEGKWIIFEVIDFVGFTDLIVEVVAVVVKLAFMGYCFRWSFY